MVVFALMLAFACVVVVPQASAVEVVAASGEVVPAALTGAEADGTVSVSKDADAATLQNCDFGISGFSRQNKGTNRAVEDVYYGYRYPIADPQGFSAIVADGYLPKIGRASCRERV